MNNLLNEALSCMLYKMSVQENLPDKMAKCFQSFMGISTHNDTECSNVVYLDILDEYADNKNTIHNALALIQERLEVGNKVKYLAVIGDGKTYDHLHTLKVEYGQELNWLIPMPGDWHILKNYQEVLLKVYFDGGLREAAKQAGYSDGVLNSIGGCNKFKRSHEFIMKIWEAMFRTFLHHFSTTNPNINKAIEQVKEILLTENSTEDEQNVSILFTLIKRLCEDESKIITDFQQYIATLSAQDETCRLWSKFILEDCLPYIGLFIAMRSGNWNLRMCSIKQMAAFFTAYDRTTYRRLIPRHIAEMLKAPPQLLSSLQDGGFVASLSGITL